MKAEFLKKFVEKDVTIAVPHRNLENQRFWYSGRIVEFNDDEEFLILARETELVRIEFDDILSVQIKRH